MRGRRCLWIWPRKANLPARDSHCLLVVRWEWRRLREEVRILVFREGVMSQRPSFKNHRTPSHVRSWVGCRCDLLVLMRKPSWCRSEVMSDTFRLTRDCDGAHVTQSSR